MDRGMYYPGGFFHRESEARAVKAGPKDRGITGLKFY